MPAPTSVPEFLDLVRRSGLVPDPTLDEFVSRHQAAGDLPETVDQVAALMVREALLTFFQAKQLKLGRYKRFTIGSKYRLLELIGAGGMGAVYLCEHTLMRRLVALKVLPVDKLEDKSNEERFYREARAVAALNHPNIVRAYDIDHFERLHFLVMEYVDGSSLQEIVSRYALEKTLFDPVRAAHYIAQAAVGMQHAHELGMVHRDIKPGNLLLDRGGVVKILDMGLARFFNKQQDSVTEKYDDKCILGTADYLAPEQAVSNIVDIRADIYSLGATFYFLLTGQTPFPDGTIAAKLVAHQTREPRPVESFRSDVPAGMLAVLRRMMAKNPADRYQEPIEVAEALTEWVSRPIAPPPAREMPVHCPLVQALAGPVAATAAAPLPLARLGSGSGRATRAGSGSGTLAIPQRTATALATAHYPPAPASGPISTSRANASPTTPIPRGSSSSANLALQPLAADGSNPVVVVQAPKRTGYFVVIGILVALLLVSGAVAAYLLGRKGDLTADVKTPPATLPAPGKTPTSNDPVPVPDPAKPALTPAEASKLEPEVVVTVEFLVKSGGGKTNAYLNSEDEYTSPTNFAARIYPVAFRDSGKTVDDIIAQYKGKTIRVRGKLTRDTKLGNMGIEVTDLRQILVVGKP